MEKEFVYRVEAAFLSEESLKEILLEILLAELRKRD